MLDSEAALREAFKKKSVDFFHTSQTPPPPPKVWKIKVPLKMKNVKTHFWGNKKFLLFSPENDLPTQKKLEFWSLVRGIITLEGGIGTRKRA